MSDFDTKLAEAQQNIRNDLSLLEAVTNFQIQPNVFDLSTVGGKIPPSEYPTTDNDIDKVRYPEIVPTDDYLTVGIGTADRIEFPVPKQFYSKTKVAQLPSGSLHNIRDIADYTLVELDESQNTLYWYDISAQSYLYNRFKIADNINVEFEEL